MDAEGQPPDDGVETPSYDLGDGWVQTTFAYWRAVLERRHAAYEATDAGTDPREVIVGGAHYRSR
ncbi:MAG: hypothetical protein ABEJ43_07365 [Haloferacaceae archaeon]